MPLIEIPTEILYQILTYLPRSSLLSLHYTSHRLANLVHVTPQLLYSQSQPYNADLQSFEWLYFLAMLERDHRLHSNLVCSKCLKTHDRTQFSDQQQQIPPVNRYCLGWSDTKWVCPHKVWTISQVKLLHQTQQLKVFHPALWPVKSCPCLKHGMYLHWLFLAVKSESHHTIGTGLRKMFRSSKAADHTHIRLRDPERKCSQHEECATLGADGTEFLCRFCIKGLL